MVWQHLKPFLLKIIEIRKLVSCKQGSLDMIKLAHLCVKKFRVSFHKNSIIAQVYNISTHALINR